MLINRGLPGFALSIMEGGIPSIDILKLFPDMGYSKAVTLAASDRSTNTLMTKLGFISVDELKGLKRLKSKRRKQEIRWVRELSKNE